MAGSGRPLQAVSLQYLTRAPTQNIRDENDRQYEAE